MFGKRINLFSLLGFQVRLDLSWIVVAVLIAWTLSSSVFPSYLKGLSTSTYWVMGIVGALGLFMSILFHEFSHSLVAKKYGMPMKGITLFIFGGVAEMETEPPGAKAEFFMAISGPIFSVALGLFLYFIYRLTVWISFPTFITGVLEYLAIINGVLAGFNLFPAFPLDGGRVLRSILWGSKGDLLWATRISTRIGNAFGLVLILFGLYTIVRGSLVGGVWYALIGVFLRNAARISYKRLLSGRPPASEGGDGLED